ncbi:Swt1 family HEPN domain-containing protein [Thermus sp. PS18]|uniref:Swt1 family HEPN domain-containing protein n=1 Tax=Thermus sp. PS18 TaxID=2849039 RepID=UPI00226456D3|nr:Swt1 family HEPN domain-containing protein [Thermus sp. PS18]UZX16386.1 Swt1 family HEPN domain-containing protein [Thermus sp. PS18]
MAVTNYERVTRALEHLRAGLAGFVEQEFRSQYGDKAQAEALRFLGDDRLASRKPISEWDAAALLKVMWEGWNEVFRQTLGQAERTLVSELREWRNKWAHQEPFSSDDAYRVLDSAERLLSAVAAPQAEELARMKQELLRVRYDEQVRAERRKLGGSLVEAAAAGALRPWREVIAPHPDVASGRYQQAEFAADLWQVYLGEAASEYQDPKEFFRRTYLTENLKHLLVQAVKRLSGTGGDPVIQLQTNFGGGKTHAMIALYHLFGGYSPAELPGVDVVMAEAGVHTLPHARRVVLVGNRISPGNPMVKRDGTVVRTLWGELAWQLGFAAGGLEEARKAYARIAKDDEHATSPGDALRELFNIYGPCLILIDEWVAYARQLHDQADLPGGTFDTQFTFAQALTESARAVKNCLVAVSLPASDTSSSPHTRVEDIEVGGVRGREALDRLRNVIGRIESPWRPASAEESFEIVRRRLFEPMTDPEQFKARDVTARAFADLYRTQRSEFPTECAEAAYERRIQAAYPIHPEVFTRLYEDWSTLAKFQRTRGVLRLMAAVIHTLWERGDRNPLILPSTIPMDDPRVQFELTRYLSENWVPVIERDVDGPSSLPVRLDAEVPNLGKYHACRRVARTIYLGSAPIQGAAHQGIEDRRIRLGCVMPGESPAVFGDALRRLAAEATYLYQDGNRFWYSTQPTVTRLAEDRSAQLAREPEKVAREIERRVREEVRQRPGEFSRVHEFPRGSQDVPDDLDVRLVILGIDRPHIRGQESPALAFAKEILEWRGSSPRHYRNTLVFLAPDQSRLQDLEESVRRYLAWESILQDTDLLNLSPQQVRQAEEQKRTANATVNAQLPETYLWLLVPIQTDPHGNISWQEIRLQGNDGLAVRASSRLLKDELLITRLAGTRLRMELDKVPLWRGDHVPVTQLIEDFARYIYLSRLKNPAVLVEAIRDGVALTTWEKDTFAYAESFDEDTGRYRGLKAGQLVSLSPEAPQGLVIKSDVAQMQLATETPQPPTGTGSNVGKPPGPVPVPTPVPPPPPPVKLPTRFHGTVTLDPIRAGAEAGKIVQEILTHLINLPGAQVQVTLEIDTRVPGGIPENVVLIVTENAKTLRFTNHGFEPD